MSDDKKNEQTKPIQDETLDKVSGGHTTDMPVQPLPRRLLIFGPPVGGHKMEPD